MLGAFITLIVAGALTIYVSPVGDPAACRAGGPITRRLRLHVERSPIAAAPSSAPLSVDSAIGMSLFLQNYSSGPTPDFLPFPD